jgi:hypothetical protein
MISRRHLAALFVVPAIAFAIEAACNRVPLLAPSGSSITLTTATSILPVNGSATVIAQLVESAGTPPQAGTHVTFTTSLGTIQPSDVTTDSSGRATALFTSSSSGTATITAFSGGATTGTNGLKILVGAAGVQKVVVNATPATVPALGGSTTISATVFDVNGSLMASIPVTFTSTAGSLSAGVVNTDASGVAATTLTTAQTSTVTANVGVGNSSTPTTGTPTTGTPTTGTPATPAASGQASGSVTVNISGAPTLVITPPTTAPTAGNVATFTFAVTAAGSNGSAIRNLNVDWGDGSNQDLGGVTGTASVVHTYKDSGTFVITATVTDAAGNTTKVSTVVFVQVAPPLSVGLTAVASISGGNTIESFTATVTGLGNSVSQNFHWVFGDATTADTTSNQTSHTYPTGSGAKNVSVTVTTSTGAQATGSVVISP